MNTQFKDKLEEIKKVTPILKLEEALYRILEAGRLDIAKEIAADALGEEVQEYTEDSDLDSLEFVDVYDESGFFPNDEEYPY